MTDDHMGRAGQDVVVVLSVVSLYFATHSSATLVSLLLLGSAGVTQFFPGVVLGLFWRRVTTAVVFTALAAVPILSRRDPFGGMNAGSSRWA
jgi:solute:Na+ symporter, SSS family